MAERLNVTVINWNDVIPNMEDVFKIYRHPSEIHLTDALVISDDTTVMGSKACLIAREYGVPSFIVQHGRGATSDYAIQNNEVIADFFLVWGQHDVEQAIKGGWAEDRVQRVGSPALAYRCTPEPDGKTVVFAPIHNERGDDINKRNSDEGRAIWKVLYSMDNILPIAKLLKHEHNLKHYPNEKFITWRNEEGHIKLIYQELLKKTSCVVSQVEGTFELLAYSMDIPVIRIKNTYHDDFFPASRIVDNIDEISDAVKDALAHPEKNRDKRIETVYQMGGSTDDNPKENIVQFIKEKRRTYVN